MNAYLPNRHLVVRILANVIGRYGEDRVQVQKLSAEGMHGIFSVRPSELAPLPKRPSP